MTHEELCHAMENDPQRRERLRKRREDLQQLYTMKLTDRQLKSILADVKAGRDLELRQHGYGGGLNAFRPRVRPIATSIGAALALVIGSFVLWALATSFTR
jgi:hypothetical protein